MVLEFACLAHRLLPETYVHRQGQRNRCVFLTMVSLEIPRVVSGPLLGGAGIVLQFFVHTRPPNKGASQGLHTGDARVKPPLSWNDDPHPSSIVVSSLCEGFESRVLPAYSSDLGESMSEHPWPTLGSLLRTSAFVPGLYRPYAPSVSAHRCRGQGRDTIGQGLWSDKIVP